MPGLFGRRREPEAGSLVEERWSSSFGLLGGRRFPEEDRPDHVAQHRRGRFELEIRKRSNFAWVTVPYKYRDFTLEGRLSIDPDNGHSAAGFVFRHLNDENFYYFLVSNRGAFRLDVVFNRNPIHLVEWTPSPLAEAETFELRVLARGERLAFFLDDEWVAEITDLTIPEGAIGFCAQNYEERPEARFRLHRVEVDSRPVEVERQYYRWLQVIPARPEFRVALARSFLDMGKPLEALGQLRRGVDPAKAGANELLLLGQAQLRAGLYPEALRSLDLCLSREPTNTQALRNKADGLYLSREFLAARDFIRSILGQVAELDRDPFLHDLLGGCEYALGNWGSAEAAYCAAIELDRGNPVYRENLARCLERQGRRAEALQLYLQAARLFFEAEIHDELSLVISRASALLEPDDTATRLELTALEGKMLYQEGDRPRAEQIFRSVLEEGAQDGTVDYLYGLLLIERGRRQEAERYLFRAAEREGSPALYWFRLAENRYLLRAAENGGPAARRGAPARRDGGPQVQSDGAPVRPGDRSQVPSDGPPVRPDGPPRLPSDRLPNVPPPDEPLERAYALSPEDPWVNNLYGQLLMDRGEAARALEFFERAAAASPGSADVHRNHADALMRLGRAAEAEALLGRALLACGEQAELLNLRGNSRVELGMLAEARADYERAIALDPDNLDYLENCATCCVELDLIMRAEELLNRILEERPSAWAFNLTGVLAMHKNEHDRARLAFEEALRLEPGNSEVTLNQVSLHLDQGHYEPARELVAGVLCADSSNRRALELQARLRDRFESRIACGGCGREWWAPRELPPQPGFSLHGEPPGEAPAGRCGSCGAVYCIGCAAAHAEGQRLVCPRCREPLRVSEEPLKYLLLQYVRDEKAAD